MEINGLRYMLDSKPKKKKGVVNQCLGGTG